MTNKNFIIGIIALLALVTSGFALTRPAPVVEKYISGDSQQLGAVTGPDSTFPCESHNGVTSCFTEMNMAQATGTLCAIAAPKGVTSKLLQANVYINATGTSMTLLISTSTTPYASTTLVQLIPYTANSTTTYQYSPGSTSTAAFLSGDYLNITQTGQPLNSVVTGRCGAVFQVY